MTKVADLTPDQWKAMKWSAQITSATVPADGKPVINFKVLDEKSKPIVGLANPSYNALTGTAIAPAYANFGFTFAKLVPASVDSPSHWVTYVVTTTPTYTSLTDRTILPATPRLPTTDNQGTMVDHGDGSYTYTFYRSVKDAKGIVDGYTKYTSLQAKADLGDLTYDATFTHRVAMQLQGTMPGTGTNTPDAITVKATVASTNPVAAYLDFRPDGGAVTEARTVTKVDACQSCHAGALLHGRKDPNLCVTCHTAQIKYGYAAPQIDAATGNYKTTVVNGVTTTIRDSAALTIDGATKFSNFDFPRWVHKIHMGEGLVKQNYNIGNVLPNEVAYPQDQRNCAKCHTASTSTPQGDNWKSKPSRLACGACHDGIDFTTGTGTALSGLTTGHLAGKGYTDDSKCSTCHEAADIAAYHVPVTPIDATVKANNVAAGYTNYASVAAYPDNLPAGAIAISYEINSVTVDASQHPVVKFRILQNGARADFNTYSAGKEIYDNFVGSPSVYVVFNAPQDGIAAPADFNASISASIKTLWAAGGTSFTGPDANGFYTATLTSTPIPATAKMVTAGVGYTYASTLPLTQTNLPKYPYNAVTRIGGLEMAAPNVWKVASGSTSRRILVENARCNTCHEKLGVFTESAFHAGQRNDAQSCNFCHNPDKASSGWSANASTFVHGIHANGGLTKKRTVMYSWENNLAAGVGYPGGISKCEACHLPDVVNFGAIYTRAGSSDLTPITTGNATALATFQANMLYSTAAYGTLTTGTTTVLSPYVASGSTYGAVPAVAAGVVTVDGANLVTSPVAAACFSCHDDAKARTHMEDIGNASIYVPRATAILKTETCLQCHGAGKAVDAQVVHQ